MSPIKLNSLSLENLICHHLTLMFFSYPSHSLLRDIRHSTHKYSDKKICEELKFHVLQTTTAEKKMFSILRDST